MKTTLLISSLLALCCVAGCTRSAEQPSAKPAGSAARQLDKAQAASTSTEKQMKEYAYAQKAEFVALMEKQLAELDKNLAEISAKLEKSSAAVQADAKPKMAALREEAASLRKRLSDITDATPGTWNGIKADSEKAYDSLKEGLNKARQWASDKIAP